LQIDRLFIERDVSGSKKLFERPCGSELLAAVQAGDVVLTRKLDRTFRSALDALDVLTQPQKRVVSLHMIDLGGEVTTNGSSKLVVTLLSAAAEAERDRIREGIRDVKADQKAHAIPGGSLRFGLTIDLIWNGARAPDRSLALLILRVKSRPWSARASLIPAMVNPAFGQSTTHTGKLVPKLPNHGSANRHFVSWETMLPFTHLFEDDLIYRFAQSSDSSVVILKVTEGGVRDLL
jgi:putative DNA-invertase from lambdoid prophage Rac